MAEGPYYESAEWTAAATAAYACALALIPALPRLDIYPRVDAGAVAQAASAATATLTLPGALRIAGGCSLPVHLVAGIFGALSGLGATFLPAASTVPLDAWDGVAPLVFAAAILSLVVMAARGAGSGNMSCPSSRWP